MFPDDATRTRRAQEIMINIFSATAQLPLSPAAPGQDWQSLSGPAGTYSQPTNPSCWLDLRCCLR